MKKPSSKIREEITKLQEALKAAETREAERIGRIALKARLGEIAIDEGELQAAFEEVANRFLERKPGSNGRERGGLDRTETSSVPIDAAQSGAGEA
ncbi:TraC family protein [Neorhizobium sp. T786]|uniref:conjugal transfer protein TraC n=1 Tax=Pseudorhizobium xiangyangii TaxID=2883104 RepID=UPI001CFFB684|nr:conjugal transfer protein TraC [Neorhizobium xiangyangii]MCB5204732.1 TraC family protein [Neorhizobium xiangyangii]